MSFIMNEFEVEEALHLFTSDNNGTGDTPNLATAAVALQALVDWTNSHSDGWPYWRKPHQAATTLQQHLHDARNDYLRAWSRGPVEDISDADLAKALRPVKAFLTRQGTDWHTVLPA